MKRAGKLAATMAIILAMITTLAQGQGKPRDIPLSIVTDDGLQLHAWLTLPSKPTRAPLVVLLPMRGRTHASYEPFIEAVFDYFVKDSAAKGKVRPYILNCDLRGHGKSTQLGDKSVSFESMSNEHYKRIPKDIAELVQYVVADSNYQIDTNAIMIVGASIGANSAALMTSFLPYAAKVAMLSPGDDYRGLVPAPAAKKYGGEMLIFASEQDSYSAKSSQALAALANGRAKLHIFKGGDHGTNIINGNPAAMRELIHWLFE